MAKIKVSVTVRRQVWREQDGCCHCCGIPLEPTTAGLRRTEEARVMCVCGTCQRARYGGYDGIDNYDGYVGLIANAACIKAQIDHLVPRIFGGSDDRENLVYACWVCNQRRNQDPIMRNHISHCLQGMDVCVSCASKWTAEHESEHKESEARA